MTAYRRPTRRTALIAGGVLLLHAAMLWLLARHAPTQNAAAEAPRVTLRLLPWRETQPEPPSRPAAPTQLRAALPAITAPATLTPATTTAASTTNPTTITAAPTAAEPPASQADRALNLALPRGFSLRPGARSPALDDPRANSGTSSAGERMATALGTDTRLIEEPLADGRRRIRQGTNCVIVTPSRSRQLFPFDDSAQRTPSLVEPCP